MRAPGWSSWSRALAIVIAVLAVVDPAVTTARRRRPVVAVVAADPRGDSVLARHVSDQLSEDFRVVPARFPTADVTVVAGDALPRSLDGIGSPAFAVHKDDARRPLTLTALSVPSTAVLSARVPVRVSVRARGVAGRTMSTTVRTSGALQQVMTTPIASADTLITLLLDLAPPARGVTAVHVEAELSGDSATARSTRVAADAAVDVGGRAASVHFFDARPTWQSTFVRRALERDPRFVVVGRIATSRNIEMRIGNAPTMVANARALDGFDVVVVGAPDALTSAQVAGLSTFMRRRGGSVVLLLNQRIRGPAEELTRVASWRYVRVDSGVRLSVPAADTGRWRATQLLYPTMLPEGADALITFGSVATGSASDTSPPSAVVWSVPFGAGRLLVSGALDAWRYRERDVSAFERVWQRLVADAAAVAPPPLMVRVARNALAPGERTELLVAQRDLVLEPSAVRAATSRARATAMLETMDDSTSVRSAAPRRAVRLWPGTIPGTFRGTLEAPPNVGPLRLTITVDSTRAEVPLLSAPSFTGPADDGRAVLGAWASARGGRLVSEAQLDDLRDEMVQRVRATTRRERWHPMRSPWWIAPFALALSLEWWLRRRRGLP